MKIIKFDDTFFDHIIFEQKFALLIKLNLKYIGKILGKIILFKLKI